MFGSNYACYLPIICSNGIHWFAAPFIGCAWQRLPIITSNADKMHVTMRDGYTLNLSKEIRGYCISYSRFIDALDLNWNVGDVLHSICLCISKSNIGNTHFRLTLKHCRTCNFPSCTHSSKNACVSQPFVNQSVAIKNDIMSANSVYWHFLYRWINTWFMLPRFPYTIYACAHSLAMAGGGESKSRNRCTHVETSSFCTCIDDLHYTLWFIYFFPFDRFFFAIKLVIF